jgi:hypothetical protein
MGCPAHNLNLALLTYPRVSGCVPGKLLDGKSPAAILAGLRMRARVGRIREAGRQRDVPVLTHRGEVGHGLPIVGNVHTVAVF